VSARPSPVTETVAAQKPPASAMAGSIAGCLLVATAAMTGVIEVFLTPLRWGTHIVPLSVILAVVVNVLLVALTRFGLRSGSFGVAVIVAWLAPVLVIVMVSRPEGDVVVPGGGAEQWVYFAMLLCGAAAGIVTRLWGDSGYARGFNRLLSR
jgi:hypothetical protein